MATVTTYYVMDSCWMEEGPTTWILSGPVCVSMLANVFFLVNIVRVLVTKLKSPGSCRYEPRNGGIGGGQPLNPTAESRADDLGDNVPARSSSWSVPSLASLRKAVRYHFKFSFFALNHSDQRRSYHQQQVPIKLRYCLQMMS